MVSNMKTTNIFYGCCPYCFSENIDIVDEHDDSVKYICRDCDEDFIVTDDGALIDLRRREVK